MRLAGVRIGADDLAGAIAAYATLLAVPSSPLAGGGVRFSLQRGSVDVAGGPPGLQAVRFVSEPGDPPLPDAPGIHLESGPDTPAGGEDAAIAIDHIVVHTAAPERAVALWRDHPGLRLALDREFPARRLRLLFFRSGGITLEYASPLPAGAGPAGARSPPRRQLPGDRSRCAARSPARGRRRPQRPAPRHACGYDGRHRTVRHGGRTDAAAPGRGLTAH